MSVQFFLTSPRPAFEGTDAVFNEISALKDASGGELIDLVPGGSIGGKCPRILFGLHKLKQIIKPQGRLKVNHIHYPALYWFPFMRFLKSPTVYSITAALNEEIKPSNLNRLGRLHRIVVTNERDAAILKNWGLENFQIIAPGIDVAGINPVSAKPGKEFNLLMASAPWTEEQFNLKGVDDLLETVDACHDLKLTLLWRGVLVEKVLAKAAALGISKRVDVVNRPVNVNEYFADAHATILLATRGDIVKTFPNSLVESLAAGKPVILTDTIPMSDFVKETKCGIVLGEFNPLKIAEVIETLRTNYKSVAQNARTLDMGQFSQKMMVNAYLDLYRKVVSEELPEQN